MKNNSQLEIVAHRGDCQYFIENTLHSVKAALEGSINAVEIDIQFTKDEVPILFHDQNLMRLLGKEGTVAEHNYLDINAMPYIAKKHADNEFSETIQTRSSPQLSGLPTKEFVTSLSMLVDLFLDYPNAKLFVEVKRNNFNELSYQRVYQCLKEILSPITQRVVMISFSYRFIRYCRAQNDFTVGYVLPKWHNFHNKMLARLKPDYLFCDTDKIPTDHIFKPASYRWVLYEVDNVQLARHFIGRGITGLETYAPKRLADQLCK